MTLDDAVRRCTEQLSRLGYEPDAEEDGDSASIAFERKGETFYLEIAGDVSYLRFSLSYELGEDDKRNRMHLYEAANDNSNAADGIATIIDQEGDVELRHDAFVGDAFELAPTLERILSALEWAKDRFFDQLGN